MRKTEYLSLMLRRAPQRLHRTLTENAPGKLGKSRGKLNGIAPKRDVVMSTPAIARKIFAERLLRRGYRILITAKFPNSPTNPAEIGSENQFASNFT